MTNSVEELLTLARQEFDQLTEADQKLFRAVAEGKAAKFSTDADQSQDSTKPTLDADRIIWLCTNSKAQEFLSYRGLVIIGANVAGKLDLSFATIDIPLRFQNCLFYEKISLEQTRLRLLDLEASQIVSLDAPEIKVEGSVLLSDGFEAKGEVYLLGASIGGQLNCSGGNFDNKEGCALCADSANITSGVFLNNGFDAKGEVRLLGASVGGELNCSGGNFYSKEGCALCADSANITSGVFLNNGFEAKGEVSLRGASIGGQLNCTGGNFYNEKGCALSADGANIEGNVYFRDSFVEGKTYSFTAKGKISLKSTRIDDTLCIKNLKNSQQMELDLRFARVGTLDDEVKSWPKENNLYLNGFTYAVISEPSKVSSKERLKWLRLQRKEEFALQPYEQLAGVLRGSGHEAAAIDVLIGKEDDRLKYDNLNIWGCFWHRFLGFTIVYGYKPQRALWFSILLVFFGMSLFDYGYQQGLISPSSNLGPFEESQFIVSSKTPPVKSNFKKITVDYPEFNSLVYSIDVFLPIVDFHQESHWLPNSKQGRNLTLPLIKTPLDNNLLRWYFWLHITFGWVLTSLWVAGFSGLVRSQNK